MAATTYTRSIAVDFEGFIGLAELRTTIIASAIVPQLTASRTDGDQVSLTFDNALSAPEITILDTLVAANALATAKAAKFVDIDRRTDELIALGFSYSAKQFPLSLEFQSRLLNYLQNRDEPEFAYPVEWNTIDDLGVHSSANASDLEAICDAMQTQIRTHVDSGTALKTQVRAAANVAAVVAIVDPR